MSINFKRIMVGFTSLLPFFLFVSTIKAQTVDWQYSLPINNFNGSYVYNQHLDNSGNSYIVGKDNFSGPYKSFIYKVDQNGNQLWGDEFTILSSDNEAYAVDTDSIGDVYVAGLTSYGGGGYSYDAYLKKYDSNGNVQWTKQFGFGTDANLPQYQSADGAYAVAVDVDDNIYVGGRTTGVASGTYLGGSADAFLRKYNPSGNVIWTKQVGTNGNDQIRDITTDEYGNVYVLRLSSGTYYNLDKYTSLGNLIWSANIVNTQTVYGDIKSDLNGSIYVSGSVSGSLPNQISYGGYDGFVMKYDYSGSIIWTKQFGTSGDDQVYGLDLKSDYVALAGYTTGIITGESQFGQADGFIKILDSDSNEIWSAQLGTSNSEEFWGIGILNNQSVTVSGKNYNSGLYISKVSQIQLNHPPTANAGVDQTVTEGDLVNFDASESSDPDGFGDIVSFEWDFGDGNFASGVSPTHTYIQDGVYTSTLTVTDSTGEIDTDEVIITVQNAKPVITPLSPIDPTLPETVSIGTLFSDSGILDSHTATIDWGDSTTTVATVNEIYGSGTVSGSHLYTTPGVYTVTLTVSDETDSSFVTTTVTILTATESIQDLVDLTESFNLQQGIDNSLDAKLDTAIGALDDMNENNDQAAINSLQSFINAVEAQRGNQITNEQADVLIAAAQSIIDYLSS